MEFGKYQAIFGFNLHSLNFWKVKGFRKYNEKKNEKDIASKNIYIGCAGILFMDYKKEISILDTILDLCYMLNI